MKVNTNLVRLEFRRLSKILDSSNFLIWDTVHEERVVKIEPFGFEEEFGLRINGVVIYSSDSSIDNGYFDTEEEFLQKIRRYKLIPFPHDPEIVDILNKLSK